MLLSAFTCKLYAQQYDKATVKITQNPIDITSLAKAIAKQTGLEYSLNMQNASLKKRIALHPGSWQLSDILKQVQQQAGLNYRILGDHILFMDYQPRVGKVATANAPAPAAPSVNITTNAKVNNSTAAAKPPAAYPHKPQRAAIARSKPPAPGIAAKTTARGTKTAARLKPRPVIASKPAAAATKENGLTQPSTTLLPVYAASDYITPKVFSLALFEGSDSAGHKKLLPRLSVPPLMKNIAATKTNQKETGNKAPYSSDIASADDVKWYRPFVKAGVSADEILYLNASLMAGIKYVYGIISYGSAFPGGRLRWGAGIPVKLNDAQQLHFTFTTGTLNRTTSPDSAIVYGVKETLTRYGAGWSKTVSPRITFQAQFHYNILKKTSDSTSTVAQNQTGDYKRFEYGRVPYTLSESYGPGGDFKRWIGIQISLFYKLF